MKASGILIFTAVISLVMGMIHWLLWNRLIYTAAWPAPWLNVLTGLLIFLGLLIPLTIMAMRWTPRWVNQPLTWVAYSWLGFVFYLFFLVVLTNGVLGLINLLGILQLSPDHRLFLARVLSIGIGATSGFIGCWGIFNMARGFKIARIKVPIAHFPEKFSGYTIAQISDVHVGPTIGRDFVVAVVRETNALLPDLIVITGDLVDGSVEQLRDQVEPLADLKAKDGVFFVTGNHEYYSGADAWITHLETLGIRVLRNEHVDIAGIFDLAGVDDHRSAQILPHHGQDVGKAIKGREPSRPLVLLAHQPKAIKHAVAAGVDLQLSGHVHGGQMIPFNWLVHLDQPFISGLYRVGKTWIYVHSGTGYWGPPMRIGTTAEIALIELVSEEIAQR